MGITGFYWVLPRFNGNYWVLLGFTRFYWVLLGFSAFYWVLPSFGWMITENEFLTVSCWYFCFVFRFFFTTFILIDSLLIVRSIDRTADAVPLASTNGTSMTSSTSSPSVDVGVFPLVTGRFWVVVVVVAVVVVVVVVVAVVSVLFLPFCLSVAFILFYLKHFWSTCSHGSCKGKKRENVKVWSEMISGSLIGCARVDDCRRYSHRFGLRFQIFQSMFHDGTLLFRLWHVFTEFYWVLPGFARHHSFLLGFTGFLFVLLGFIGYYWLFTGFYLVLLDFIGYCWLFSRFYVVLLGFT